MFRTTLILLLLVSSKAAYADVVWPALYLEERVLSFWPIIIGLIIEFWFIKYTFSLNFKKAAIVTFAANFLSTVVGIIAIPLTGFVLDIIPELFIYNIFDVGTFNPFAWSMTFIEACLINSYLETIIYRKILNISYSIRSRKFLLVFISNIFSVAIALASLWLFPIASL